MSRTTGLLLIVWNVILSVLLGWSLLRKAPTAESAAATEDAPADDTTLVVNASRDTSVLKDARIAYFFLDTLRAHMELLKEREAHYKSEGQRLEGSWQKQLAKAQAEADQLMNKDHTYSTKAEMAADQERLQELEQTIAQQKQTSEERMQRLELDILAEVSSEIEDFLADYNETAGFDYIISVEPGGQVWVGNPDLDISQQVIDGMNARHRAKKKPAAP